MGDLSTYDFLNQNSLRAFPIRESLNRKSIDGVFTIPDAFIVDFKLAATSDPSFQFYISRISNFIDVIVIDISDGFGASVGTFTVQSASHTVYKEYLMANSGAYADAYGKMTFAGLDAIQSSPAGVYTFTLSATEFESCTVIPSRRGINRIVFNDAFGNTFSASGDILLEGRTNIRFSYDPLLNKIIADVGNGLGLNQQCAPEDFCIKTINGIPPDAENNFTLDFLDCAVITPQLAGISITDVCSKTCAGCDELETLTNRLIQIESDLYEMKVHTSQIEMNA